MTEAEQAGLECRFRKVCRDCAEKLIDKAEGDWSSTPQNVLPFAAAFCMMQCTDRQERLTEDMHKHSATMKRLTWAMAGMTAAVVVLSIVLVWKT